VGFGSLFEIGKSGLLSSQYALNVVSHNVANANTPGFHRQRPELSTSQPERYGGSWLGRGVQVDGVRRDYESFIERQISGEIARQGGYETKTTVLRQVEDLLDEDAFGLTGVLQDFFNAWDDLAADPESRAHRVTVIEAGKHLAETVDELSRRIYDLELGVNREIPARVDEVNELIARVWELNQQVMLTGGAADVLDERDRLVNEMAAFFPEMDRFQDGNGRVTLIVRGKNLVDTEGYETLDVEADSRGYYDVVIASTGESLGLSTSDDGRLAALTALRDDLLPGYLADLDKLAYNLAQEVNTLHEAGYGLDGGTGRAFFSAIPAESGAARNLSVAVSDADQVAAASASGQPGNNVQARAISALQRQEIIGGETPGDWFAGIVAEVGLDAEATESRATASESVLLQLRARRDAVSGVSLDEEAADLIRYQKAYEASARILRITDELFETLMEL